MPLLPVMSNQMEVHIPTVCSGNCWIYPQLLISASSILDDIMLRILKVSGPLNDVKNDTFCIPLNAFTSVVYTMLVHWMLVYTTDTSVCAKKESGHHEGNYHSVMLGSSLQSQTLSTTLFQSAKFHQEQGRMN